ncbi:MAG TPA: arginase family protein [Anaerolineae bacterium]|nr:arginase family protein [Anaerolineae bacterium]
MIGDEQQGGSKGPERIAQSRVRELLADEGVDVAMERVERGTPFRDSVSASFAVNQQLAAIVRRMIAAGQFPLVLAGSCDASLGIVAALDSSRCGVIWFDAHGDYNTPETTITGFFGGMSLAVITGHCYQKLWAQMSAHATIEESKVLMMGVRDLDALERERLEHSAIHVVQWHEGKPQGDVYAALDQLTQRVQRVYVHIDLDALDPQVAPGIVDTPVPGGLALQDIEELIRAVADRFHIAAAALTTYNPDRDVNGKTLRAALRVIQVLAECLIQIR